MAAINTSVTRIDQLEISGPDAEDDVQILFDDGDDTYTYLTRAETIALTQDLADRLGLSLIDPATGVRVVK